MAQEGNYIQGRQPINQFTLNQHSTLSPPAPHPLTDTGGNTIFIKMFFL